MQTWTALARVRVGVLACVVAGCGASSNTVAVDASLSDGGRDALTREDASPHGDGSAHGDADAARDGGHDANHDAGGSPSDATPASDAEGDVGPVSSCDAGAGPGDRVITVTNQCAGQTIVVGVNGGYVEDCNAGSCPAGTTCSTTRTPPGCFWDFPAPTCGSAILAQGETATYVLSAPPITAPGGGGAIKWSGNVYASTGCASDGTGCKTAQCATSVAGMTVVQACPDGTGPEGPTTLAEFTLAPDGSDFYDVSSINGVNVPVSMGPITGAPDPSNPYTCATAGAVAASTGLAACSWSFDPSITIDGTLTDYSTLLRAVAPGGAACSSDADCTGGDVCGIPIAFGSNGGSSVCGPQVAWWTADELCTYTGNAFGAPLNCGASVSGQGTDSDLYGCDGANPGSCYSTTAGSTCCGCPSWNVGGQPLAVAAGFQCYASNTEWQSVAEPWAAFLKNACPTAYSFPFDDATSTFTCSTPNPGAANPNSTGYAITFCPGGKDGD